MKLWCWLWLGLSAAAGQDELLQNGGLEGAWQALAPGWTDNLWGTPPPEVRYGRETARVHGGQAAQRVEVLTLPPGSGAIVRQLFTFQRGRTYEARVWLRGTAGTLVGVQLRRAGQWYESGAFRLLTLTPEWQQVTIRGGFGEDVPGFLGLHVRTPGTLWLDDASLRDVSAETSSTSPPPGPVPPRFFGIHLNKLGTHNTWPAIGAGLLRLWDTGTTWAHLQPERERWNWTRLDYYLRHVERHAPTAAVVYTLGITPSWAALPGGKAIYGGSTAPPASLDDWRTYVRTVAERYRGRIRSWEIWNESNINVFYTGSVGQMLELARAAHEVLKEVDPANVVLTPNVTRSGLAWLDEYLALGGGRWADVVSFHRYPSPRPEDDLPEYAAVRHTLAAHGLSQLPVWNTEGAVSGSVGPDPAAARAAVARAYLVQWCQGLGNFSWYCWDIHWEGGANLSATLTGAELTPAGVAYREVAGWLVGSTITRREVTGDRWLLELRRPNGATAHVLWSAGAPASFALPAAWRATRLRDLSGGVQPAPATLTLGPEPVLVE